MITEKIKIAGKQVTLAYCYATEIAYKNFTGENIAVIIDQIARCTKEKTSPDTERSIYLILSAHQAYCTAHNIETPTIVDVDIMNNATPVELGTALGTILNLWGKFYNVLPDEPKQKKGKGKGKN